MIHFPKTLILRHKRENLNKCSLRGLEIRSDMIFLTYPKDPIPDLTNYCILSFDSPLLNQNDSHLGICLIDGTWRYAAQMSKHLTKQPNLIFRSLPLIKTAYPRRQLDCHYPDRGLASLEALYVAYRILKRNLTGLLDHYYWKDQFLSQYEQE